MTWLMIVAAILLLLPGPLLAANVGINPLLPALAGVACGLIAAVRGAQPPADDGSRVASPGAEADAQVLANQTIARPADTGVKITDIGIP